MSKYLFFMFLIFMVTLSSCYPPYNEHKPCNTDDDCNGLTCVDGNCFVSKCLDYEINCGKGKCIPIKDKDYYCSCDDDAILYEGVCVPRCNGFSQECRELFPKKGIMSECNMDLGHCDNKCSGKESCEEGYYCNDGSCDLNDYPCETDDDCKDNPEDRVFCNLEFNICWYPEDYCIKDSDCRYREDKRTICDTTINRCGYPDIYCSADYDCKGSPNGKTVCNIELRKCEKPEVIEYTKTEFSEDYATAYCNKYGTCRGAQNENMEQCIAYYKDSIQINLNDEYCEIFSGNVAKEIINCVNNYSCTGEDDNMKIENECVRNNYAYLCKDTAGKNIASIRYSELYCDLAFTCNESIAINKFGDIENCKNIVSGIRYKDFQNDRYCENFNNEAYGEYLRCVENLTCENLSTGCQTEFSNACGEY